MAILRTDMHLTWFFTIPKQQQTHVGLLVTAIEWYRTKRPMY
jgi:hypothetical protein